MFKQTAIAQNNLLGKPSLLRLLAVAALCAALLSAGSCSLKPDSALCGEYYANVVQLGAGTHPALAAAARSSGGKQAIIEHCLALSRSQAQCAAGAASLQDAAGCEQAEKRSFMERYFQ